MNRDGDPPAAAKVSDLPRRSVTDSPWFWGLVFSGMAWVALTAMDHKFGRRQQQIEGAFKAREYRAKNSVGRPPVAPDASGDGDFDVDYAAPERTIISLGPLRWLALAVMCVSTVALVRGRMTQAHALQREQRGTAPEEGLP